MSISSKKIVKIAKALADENRYKVFKTIADKGEIVCKDITDLFNLSQPTISHHLKILIESDLIEVRKDGKWSYFSVKKVTINSYLFSIKQHIK